MSTSYTPTPGETVIKAHYMRTAQFGRPICINILSRDHSQARAKEVLEAALKGVEVVEHVTPSPGMSFMNLPGVFDDRGAQIKDA